MQITFDDLCRQEVEFYTHKISQGDITPLVYEILKGTKDPDGLLRHLGYKSIRKNESKETKALAPNFATLFAKGIEVN